MQLRSNVERVNQDESRMIEDRIPMSCLVDLKELWKTWNCCLTYFDVVACSINLCINPICIPPDMSCAQALRLVDIPCPHVWQTHKYHQLQKSSVLMEVIIIKLNGIITRVMNCAPLLNLMYNSTSFCPNSFQKVFSQKISLVCWARVSSWWGAQT